MATATDAPKAAPKAQATGQAPAATEAKPAPAPAQGPMAPRPASPFVTMRRLAEEMDRIFEDFGLNLGLRQPNLLTRGHELLRREAGLIPAEWSPHVDILRREGQLVVRADLPGMARDDIKVEITPEALTIQGERKHEEKGEREGWLYNERSFGRFYRSIPLPEGIDPAKAAAEFRDGVLEVVMPAPATAEPRARRLEVKQGA